MITAEALQAFIVAFPPLVNMINTLGTWIINNNAQEFLLDLEKHIDALEKAKTEEDKYNACKNVLSSIRSLT
jgi:hypothetical protein